MQAAVSTVDLLPALLKANGAEIPKKLDGMDILVPGGKPDGRGAAHDVLVHGLHFRRDGRRLEVPAGAGPRPAMLPRQQRLSGAQKDLYFQNPALAEPLARKLGSYLTETPACRYPDTIQWSSKLLKEYSQATRPEVQPGK